jgi:hypothetical protein
LDRRGINLPLCGPDHSGLKWPVSDINYDAAVGAYDLHSYLDDFALMPPGMSSPEQGLKAWVDYANARGKPFFMTEFGTMKYGWYGRHPGPASHRACINNAEVILRCLHLGVEGFNRWSFVNRGDLDGQWQLVDTWDIDRQALLPEFRPHPGAYLGYGIITRFLKRGSTILATHVDGVISGWQQYVHAQGWRSPDGHHTLAVLTSTEEATDITLDITGLSGPTTWHKYQFTSATHADPQATLNPLTSFTTNPNQAQLHDHVPGLSITIYSTKHLTHAQPAQ